MTSTALVRRPIWKPVVTVLVAAAGPPAGLVAAFVSLVTWSGCLLTCEGERPDPLLGALLALLALGLMVSGPVLAWALLRSRAWVVGTVVGPVLAGVLLLGGN